MAQAQTIAKSGIPMMSTLGCSFRTSMPRTWRSSAIRGGEDRPRHEPGKLADIVVLNGDPLANVSNLLNVAMVIKGGEVVVERK